MKKLILSLAILGGIALTAQAQTEKGKTILGGNVYFNSAKSDAEGAKAANELSIVPSAGYFVADNIAIGTGIGYQTAKANAASVVGKTEAFLVSPFGRYYKSLNDQFKFFGQLSVPLAFGSAKAVDADLEVGDKTGSTTSIGVALSPGFAYFPTSKIGIEFTLNGIAYENYKVKDGDDNELEGAGSQSFSIGADFFSPRIGIQFYF